MKRRIKRTLTLLEIMIVIFLITLITGVIGYNMKGSLDKGKAFRTVQAQAQLHDMLLLALSDGEPMTKILENPASILKSLGLAKDPDKLLKDGWGEAFAITANGKSDFRIKSQNLAEYEAKQKRTKDVRPTQDASDEE
ncbi:MAG TPA: type II secretion system protein [Chlamydiales bacterium]|jgi:type II secretory pathway pseudopilin PulG|nr:type II secretion system protein [Chlamydiales bacterium]